jgi:hypothetical protein
MLAQLDLALTSLESPDGPLASDPVVGIDTVRAAPAAAPSLQDAQIERLHAQLAVLERAVARYERA